MKSYFTIVFATLGALLVISFTSSAKARSYQAPKYCASTSNQKAAIYSFCDGNFAKFTAAAGECSHNTLRNLEKTRNTLVTAAGDLIYGEETSKQTRTSNATLNSAKTSMEKVERYAGNCCLKMIEKFKKDCPANAVQMDRVLARQKRKGQGRITKADELKKHNATSQVVTSHLGTEASRPKTALGTGIKNIIPFAGGAVISKGVTWGSKIVGGAVGRVCSAGWCGMGAGGSSKGPLWMERVGNWYNRQITNGIERRHFPGPGVPKANAINDKRVAPYDPRKQNMVNEKGMQVSDHTSDIGKLCQDTSPEYRDEHLAFECQEWQSKCNLIYGGDCPRQ